MTSAIEGPPNTYDFGLSFNYATWTPGTVVDLINIPWNNDYRDVVRFADRVAQKTYFDTVKAMGLTIDNISYLKFGEPLSLEIPFNKAIQYNYLRASNPTQPIPGDSQRDYFYFITNVEYVAPSTTRFTLQLDIFQTFIYDVSFGQCYIDRGHIGIANENAFNDFGREYLTIPEGLDIGVEYQTVTKRDEQISKANLSSTDDHDGPLPYDILIISAVDLTADRGTVDDPLLSTARGSVVNGLPSGATYYAIPDLVGFIAFMHDIADTPWISQGILSITAIPSISRYAPEYDYGPAYPTPPFYGGGQLDAVIPPKKYSMYENWRESNDIVSNIPDRYKILKKLLTYPYMVVELTTFQGSPLLIKPESWNDPDATIVERFTAVAPAQRVSFSPFKYNALSDSPTDDGPFGINDGQGDDYGEYIDFSVLIDDFPTFAIVNNGAISYLAANKNGLMFQFSNAGWQQQRALGNAQISYDQASSGIQMSQDLTQIGIGADTAQTAQNNSTAADQTRNAQIGGAAGGLLGMIGNAPNPGGMIGSGANALLGAGMAQMNLGVQQNQNTMSLAIRNAAANAANQAQVGNAGFLRDTNRALAEWAANGDYQNNIAAVNAKVQDAQLIQPSVSGQVGGNASNLIYGNMKLSMRVKMIDPSSMRVVGEYFLRYGYAVRKFAKLPADLMVMQKFTYWKLLETYISTAPMPEAFKQIIRGIFEKGVTVWRDPADIGNTDLADNAPLTGITL